MLSSGGVAAVGLVGEVFVLAVVTCDRCLGRPSRQSEETRVLAAKLRADEYSLRETAAALGVTGILTAASKSAWCHSSVAALLRSSDATS